MKIIFLVTSIFFCSIANAEIYKCILSGKISYQDEPCKKTGGVGHLFEKREDISVEQQIRAKAKLEADLARFAEKERIEKEAQDKERKIRAEEEKALAAQQYAEQVRRQAEALEERNYIESRRPKVIYDRWSHNPGKHHSIRPKHPTEKKERKPDDKSYERNRMKISPPDRMNP